MSIAPVSGNTAVLNASATNVNDTVSPSTPPRLAEIAAPLQLPTEKDIIETIIEDHLPSLEKDPRGAQKLICELVKEVFKAVQGKATGPQVAGTVMQMLPSIKEKASPNFEAKIRELEGQEAFISNVSTLTLKKIAYLEESNHSVFQTIRRFGGGSSSKELKPAELDSGTDTPGSCLVLSDEEGTIHTCITDIVEGLKDDPEGAEKAIIALVEDIYRQFGGDVNTSDMTATIAGLMDGLISGLRGIGLGSFADKLEELNANGSLGPIVATVMDTLQQIDWDEVLREGGILDRVWDGVKYVFTCQCSGDGADAGDTTPTPAPDGDTPADGGTVSGGADLMKDQPTDGGSDGGANSSKVD